MTFVEFLDWVNAWVAKLVELFDSMVAWKDHFFPAAEEETSAEA